MFTAAYFFSLLLVVLLSLGGAYWLVKQSIYQPISIGTPEKGGIYS